MQFVFDIDGHMKVIVLPFLASVISITL